MAEIMVRFDDLRRYCEKRHCGIVPLEYIKQIRTIPTFSNWISCSERLPDEGKDVIVYTKAWEEHIQIAHIQYDGIMWELTDGEFYFSMADVTHWMPLPEPPEKESEHNENIRRYL